MNSGEWPLVDPSRLEFIPDFVPATDIISKHNEGNVNVKSLCLT